MKPISIVLLNVCGAMIMLFSTTFSTAEVISNEQAPDYIDITVLADIYEPVLFDHQLHAGYAACVECHHHTASTSPTDPSCKVCHRSGGPRAPISCRECHPVNRFQADYLSFIRSSTPYHVDTPSLKGAYHLKCIDCHEAIGTGPTTCTGCHKFTDKAERIFYTGHYSPSPTNGDVRNHQ